jgi:hypothetical protein
VRRSVGLALLLACLCPAWAAARTVDPLTCEGYRQDRQFVDAQSWWTQTPGASGSDFGHIHVGACIPEREDISHWARLHVRVILHDNPGEIRHVILVSKTVDQQKDRITDRTLEGESCPVGTCTHWLSWHIRPNWFNRSGLQELRIRGLVNEPNGEQMRVSMNWQTYIWNDQPREDITVDPGLEFLRGKGWYSGAGYCEAGLTSVPLPDDPVLAPWSPSVRMVDHQLADDLPVTHHTARLDPDFHNGVEGTVLLDGPDSYEGPLEVSAEPGSHKLFLRSDCDDPRGSTNSGVLVVPFTAYQPPAP